MQTYGSVPPRNTSRNAGARVKRRKPPGLIARAMRANRKGK